MHIAAHVLADSQNPVGVRLTTIECHYPRSIHAEVLVHRVFSRNAASSRAIPLSKMMQRVADEPFVPLHWGRNQKGMQAGDELPQEAIEQAKLAVLALRDQSIATVKVLESLGLHKQIGNRYLEPFQWYVSIISATEWSNFLHLRAHTDAEPHIHDLAVAIQQAIAASQPRPLQPGEWHLPFVQPDEHYLDAALLARVSAARCARVSYLTHSGRRDLDADQALFERLLNGGHMSPLEHPAMASADTTWRGNYRGFVQLRKLVPGEADRLATLV